MQASPTAERRAVRQHSPIAGLIPLLLMLPGGAYYLDLIPSMGLGTILPSLLCLLAWQMQPSRVPHYRLAPTHAALICGVVALHLMIASALQPVDLVRGLSSFIPLAINLFGSIALAELLTKARSRHIDGSIRSTLFIMGAAAALGAAGWLQPDIASFGKSVFPFTEPSHLALSAAPLLLFVCVRAKGVGARLAYLGSALLATAVLQNLTMAVICMLIASVCLPLRYLTPLLLLLAPAALNIDLSYYTERLDFSEDSQNLSALVFLQGWLLIGESWDSAGLLGRGFQQLGVFGTDVYTSELIQLMNNDMPMNLLDGGFVLSKLLSEFGLLGAALVALYARLAWRAMRWLRARALHQDQIGALPILAASSIVAYSIELLIRGAGYFTPSGVLLLASLWIWLRQPHSNAGGNLRPRRP